MSQFTITAVSPDPPREWTGDHGTFLIYDIEFEGEQGRGKGDTKRKADSPAPKVGDVLDAEIVQKAGRRPELKRIPRQNGGSLGGGGSRGKSPQESRQIARMNSHAHALTYWKLKRDSDPSFAIDSWDEYTAIVDLFFGDVLKAGEQA
jgi:hypothetical protein